MVPPRSPVEKGDKSAFLLGETIQEESVLFRKVGAPSSDAYSNRFRLFGKTRRKDFSISGPGAQGVFRARFR
jgi:hypothetical protein